MFNGLKNFAINRVLRHVADNPRLNKATNWLALIPAVIGGAQAVNANWALMLKCCEAPGSLAEALKVGSAVVGAIVLFLAGKFPGLSNWKPIADAIIAEAEKEILESAAKDKAAKQ